MIIVTETNQGKYTLFEAVMFSGRLQTSTLSAHQIFAFETEEAFLAEFKDFPGWKKLGSSEIMARGWWRKNDKPCK